MPTPNPFLWMRLYQDLLVDPKIRFLDDHLYRRMIEFFLFASVQDQKGLLPPVEEMAYYLRCDADALLCDLRALAQPNVAIVAQGLTGWVVTNFEKRQRHSADVAACRTRQKAKSAQAEAEQAPVEPPAPQDSEPPQRDPRVAWLANKLESGGLTLNGFMFDQWTQLLDMTPDNSLIEQAMSAAWAKQAKNVEYTRKVLETKIAQAKAEAAARPAPRAPRKVEVVSELTGRKEIVTLG